MKTRTFSVCAETPECDTMEKKTYLKMQNQTNQKTKKKIQKSKGQIVMNK